MVVLIRFWRSLTKLTLTLVLERFFHGSISGFFRIGSGFLADPDSEKKADPDTILKKLF